MKDNLTSKRGNPNLSVNLGAEIKQLLREKAEKRGMDLSKLARAILTNYVRPGTFQV